MMSGYVNNFGLTFSIPFMGSFSFGYYALRNTNDPSNSRLGSGLYYSTYASADSLMAELSAKQPPESSLSPPVASAVDLFNFLKKGIAGLRAGFTFDAGETKGGLSAFLRQSVVAGGSYLVGGISLSATGNASLSGALVGRKGTGVTASLGPST